MGLRGRKPRPAELQIRADRRSRRDEEPKHETGLPEPPTTLDDDAKREWFRLVPTLDASILSTADRNELGRYCTLWAQWEALQQTLQSEGLTYDASTEKQESFKPRPEFIMAISVGDQMYRLSAKFGLTPSDRASIGIVRSEGKTSQDRKAEKYGLRRVK